MLSSFDLEKYGTKRCLSAKALCQKSKIAFLVERFFRGLQRCSVASRLVGTETDLYIGGWLIVAGVLGILSYCWYPDIPFGLKVILLGASILRVADITQATVNIALFDRLGEDDSVPSDTQTVQNVTRSLVLLLWNFVELMIWFGLAYVTVRFAEDPVSLGNRFYFSAITQLTIGYGDLKPLRWGKALAAAQGALGWIVTVIVIARFVSSLPRLRSHS
jgi:hypothetical protein